MAVASDASDRISIVVVKTLRCCPVRATPSARASGISLGRGAAKLAPVTGLRATSSCYAIFLEHVLILGGGNAHMFQQEEGADTMSSVE
eukprot:3304975-Amphidinium_carterae.1